MMRMLRWLRGRFTRTAIDRDIEDEIRFHLEKRREEYQRFGMSRREASRATTKRFGDEAAVISVCREINDLPAESHRKDSVMRDLLQDVRQSFRILIRDPGFAVVAITTLALGIGANSAVFTAVNSVLLSPLPYDEPSQLLGLYTGWEQEPRYRGPVSGLDFHDFREDVEAFEHLAALYSYREEGLDLMGPNGPMRIRSLPVSSGYFETYRATPQLGRTFREEEETADARVAVLSHDFWRTILNADPDIVGSTITLDDNPYTVIGVMRRTFADVNIGDVDVWIPQDLQPGNYNSRGNQYLGVIGRLRDGYTLEQAQAQLDAVDARIVAESPGNSWKRQWVISMYDDVVRESGTMLYVLMGASALVLLVACVNVANIALARGLSRRKEMGIRIALGSRRGRLVRQLMTESVVVAAIGGGLGLIIAFAGMEALLALSPDSLARAEEIGFDASLAGFTIVVTLAAGMLLGIMPSFGLTDGATQNALRENSRSTTPSKRSRLARSALVTGQVSLAVMLLVGAGLLMRSFVNLQRIESGYEPRQVSTFEVHLPDARYNDPEDRIGFHRNLQTQLASLPGVRSTGATSWLPVNGLYHQWGFRWDGADEDQGFAIQVRVIEGAYFETLRVPLMQGRTFDDRDRLDSEPVAILNERAARLAFGDDLPLNRRVSVGGREWMVAGVVGNVAFTAQGDVGPMIYLPHAQFGDNRNWALIQVVATNSESGDITSAARQTLSGIDRQLVVYRPRPMSEIAARQIARERFAFTLMSVFAVISLALAGVGLYGVLSYSVTQRFHELGIRRALGARGTQVLHIVARQGAILLGGGLILGLGGALLSGRFVESLMFDVSVRDPLTFGVVVLVIVLISICAMTIPVRRAIAADPVNALRSE